jgi:hypothetical protein
MERELRPPLYRLPRQLGKDFSQKYVQYQPWVLLAVMLWGSDFGRALYKARTAIERSFGHAGSFGGGRGPLPAWGRGWARVRTWVWAKLLINAARILRHQGRTASFA